MNSSIQTIYLILLLFIYFFSPLFYLYHIYASDVQFLKWQLNDPKHLVPQTYNLGIKIDTLSRLISKSNVESDYLNYYNQTTIAETFQVGFGDLCWIPDQFVLPIIRMINNEKIETPIAIQRFPKMFYPRFFPKILSGNYTFFDYLLPDVPDCNNGSSEKCKQMPLMSPFLATANGRRQMRHFLLDNGIDTSSSALMSESSYYEFMARLSRASTYCSPYVS